MTSKTDIEKKLQKKENPKLRKLIILLKKQKSQFWLSLANLAANPKRKAIAVNIEKINRVTKKDDKVLVPGKVLAQGSLEHPVTIAAFSLSEGARQKLKNAKVIAIEQILHENPQGKDIKIII